MVHVFAASVVIMFVTILFVFVNKFGRFPYGSGELLNWIFGL